MDEKAGSNVVEVGVDLSEFYMSVEWDILEVPAVRYNQLYLFTTFMLIQSIRCFSHQFFTVRF